jgi:predicted nuclease with RNAse H fold
VPRLGALRRDRGSAHSRRIRARGAPRSRCHPTGASACLQIVVLRRTTPTDTVTTVLPNADPCWAGVDVGGKHKGFHVAVLDTNRLIVGPANVKTTGDVAALLRDVMPVVIGIDSPCRPADPGGRSRACERELVAAVCGLRYTPDADMITSGGTYYEWIRNGFALYEALANVAPAPGWKVIEVFPTASWTRLYEPRGACTRAAWSRAALRSLGLSGIPDRRLNQDDRDAIVAAWTARLRSQPDGLDWFGDIAAPTITAS